MANEQTVTLVLARLLGFSGTIEKHTPVVMKRRNAPLRNVPGDGRNKISKVHDPVKDYEPITLTLNVEKSKAFLATARAMFDQQMLDPTTAQPLLLMSNNDAGAPQDTLTTFKAVMQRITFPSGDTNTHELATAEIEVEIEGIQ